MLTMDLYKIHTLLQFICLLVAAFGGVDSQFLQQRYIPWRSVERRTDKFVDYSPQPFYIAAVHIEQEQQPTEGPENDYRAKGYSISIPYHHFSNDSPANITVEPPRPQNNTVEEPKDTGIANVTEPPPTTVSVVSGITDSVDQCQNEQDCVFYSVAEKHGAAVTGSVSGGGELFVHHNMSRCENVTTSKFRTYDGTCNNHQNYGAAFTPLARLLPPEYDDGVGTPRQRGEDGQPLPSPRLVSRLVHRAGSSYQPFTHMMMQWGQWVDHDMTGVLTSSNRKNPIKCCGQDGGPKPANSHKDCFPIVLPAEEDHFVGSCMEFVRSLAATDSKGVPLSPREQVNSLNSFIDGSQIYGPSSERAALLRVPDDILMKMKGDFPPENPDQGCILRNGTSDYCFLTGDIRTHENPALASLHVIWLREHNRMARELRQLKPSYSNEDIFQLTRKIIGALQQVFTYNDYLPIMLGKDAHRLRLISRQGRTIYNPKMDPRVFNEFSAAAMRFGHSSVPSAYMIGKRVIPLNEMFSRPSEVLDNLDDLLLGLMGVNEYSERALQAVDRDMVVQITKHLFQPTNRTQGRGLDLASLNIQRGRDHGIPPYTKWRAHCGLRPLYGFNDTDALGPFAINLAKCYRSVNDIDLFTAMLHEPVDTGLVGPTGRCLVGKQFVRAKFADRFFFDNNIRFSGFNKEQVQALRNMTFSKIICQTTKIDAVPFNIFRFISPVNPLVTCAQLREQGLNLSLF